MAVSAAPVVDWPTMLRAAFARQKKKPPVDLAELLRSPEAMAARGLTAALIGLATTAGDRRLVADAFVRGDDLPSFWAAGHGGDDGPHDLHVTFRPAERAHVVRHGPTYQAHLLRRYCDWRREGVRGGYPPTDTAMLDPRLVAVANAASTSEIHELADDLGPIGPLFRERVEEYRRIGLDLLTADPALACPLPGPARGEGLPRRSWQPVPVEDVTVPMVNKVLPPAGGATDLADDTEVRTP